MERIISKCLETEPDLRYQHAADLRTDLDASKWIALGADGPRTAARESTRPLDRRCRGCRRTRLGRCGLLLLSAQASALTDKDTIVLAEFTNPTGDPVFDDTLRQGLAVQLQQSPFLSLISDDRIRRTLPLMNQPADARLTPDMAQGVCVRTASTAVLEDRSRRSAVSTSSACARTLHDRRHPRRRAGASGTKEEVLSTLSQIATRFRTRVGESLATIEKHSTPLRKRRRRRLKR